MPNTKTIQVPVSLLQNFVGYISKSAALLELAGQERQQAKQAAPEVVDQLVKQGLLDESQRTVAQTSLGSNHVKVLEALRKTASLAQPTSMGGPADQTTELTAKEAADQKFLRDIGL
jgi:hypothetical protein